MSTHTQDAISVSHEIEIASDLLSSGERSLLNTIEIVTHSSRGAITWGRFHLRCASVHFAEG